MMNQEWTNQLSKVCFDCLVEDIECLLEKSHDDMMIDDGRARGPMYACFFSPRRSMRERMWWFVTICIALLNQLACHLRYGGGGDESDGV